MWNCSVKIKNSYHLNCCQRFEIWAAVFFSHGLARSGPCLNNVSVWEFISWQIRCVWRVMASRKQIIHVWSYLFQFEVHLKMEIDGCSDGSCMSWLLLSLVSGFIFWSAHKSPTAWIIAMTPAHSLQMFKRQRGREKQTAAPTNRLSNHAVFFPDGRCFFICSWEVFMYSQMYQCTTVVIMMVPKLWHFSFSVHLLNCI